MKRAGVVLFGIGILLILWGAGDLVCWGTTGKELLERYPDSGAVAELVEHTFIGGWIKAALGLLAIGVCAAAFGKAKKS